MAAPIAADRDPDGMYITAEEGKRSLRTAPYDEGQRLLIVTGETFKPGTGDAREGFARLTAWTRRHFPGTEVAYRWAAQDNDATDTVPLVGPFHPGSSHTYVATGFGGWGMSGGVMAGQLLTGLITGSGPSWAGLYDPRRLWSAVREAPAFLKHQAEVTQHFVSDRLRSSHADSVAEIAPGSGAVVRGCGSPAEPVGSVPGCLPFGAAEAVWTERARLLQLSPASVVKPPRSFGERVGPKVRCSPRALGSSYSSTANRLKFTRDRTAPSKPYSARSGTGS